MLSCSVARDELRVLLAPHAHVVRAHVIHSYVAGISNKRPEQMLTERPPIIAAPVRGRHHTCRNLYREKNERYKMKDKAFTRQCPPQSGCEVQRSNTAGLKWAS